MCNCNQSTAMPMRALIPELEDIIHGEVQKVKRMVNPDNLTCKGFPKELLPAGAANPADALEAIVQRAVELMSFTIDELNRIRKAVLKGAQAGFPLIGDAFGTILQRRMHVDVNSNKAWINTGPGGVGLVIRWLTNIRDLLKSGHLRYECLNTDNCPPGRAAWVFAPNSDADLKDPARPDFYKVHLCRIFWTPDLKGSPAPIPAKMQRDFQALALIHEVSHIYYTTTDDVKGGPWVAECIAQFIGETNELPSNPGLAGRCR